MVDANDGFYQALWPRSPRQSKVKPLAKRLDTLNGKTIAQVWDQVFRGDEVFEFLEEGIKARYPEVKFVSWKDFGNTPGHINHWSKRSFVSMLSRYGTVDEVRSPFPWTMVLVRV